MEIGSIQSSTQALAVVPSPMSATETVENQDIVQAVKALSETELFGQDNELTFVLDRETRKPVVRIVNRQTNEVIRQIPPESVLRLAEDLRLLQE
jgi:flagellar protein FlaG